MIRADEARKRTQKGLKNTARRFINDVVNAKIIEESDKGYFCANINLQDLHNELCTGVEIVNILVDEYGYNAELNGDSSYDCYITVDWGTKR